MHVCYDSLDLPIFSIWCDKFSIFQLISIMLSQSFDPEVVIFAMLKFRSSSFQFAVMKIMKYQSLSCFYSAVIKFRSSSFFDFACMLT